MSLALWIARIRQKFFCLNRSFSETISSRLEVRGTEIIKIVPETREELQDAPCARPPHPLPMAEAGEAVKDATEVWGYLTAANAPEETQRAFERVCERAGVPYIIDKAGC